MGAPGYGYGLGLLLLFLFVPPGTAQQAAPPLTLEECIRRALAVPSPVSLARKDHDIADADRIQARAGFLPHSAITSGYTYNSTNAQDRSSFSFVALNGMREYVALASVFQEIDASGRLRAEYALAQASRRAAAANVGIAERELKRAVASAYYRLLLARHLVKALGTSLDESRQFERRASQLLAAGEAARADVVKASAQVSFLTQALGTAELAAKLANQDLAAYWTKEVSEPVTIVDVFEQPLPPPASAATETAPFLRRFEFRLLDAQRDGFRAAARGAKSNLYPHLGWTFQYGLDVNKVTWNNRGYAAFVNLNIPVFDWFRSLSAARQFESRAAQAVDSRSIAERRYSQEYQSALARAEEFYKQVQQCSAQVALSEEDLRLSRLRYDGGEGTALDVVTAQNQLSQARANYYSSVANYLGARWDLEVSAGR